MYVFIFSDKVAGVCQNPDQEPPTGFSIAEAPDLDFDSLYWDGSTVRVKPDRPSESAFWDELEKEWREPAPPELPTEQPDWEGLLRDLRGSSLWATAFEASKLSLPCNSAFTVLYGTLTRDRDMVTLQWAIVQLRGAMAAEDGPGDFVEAEIDAFNDLLAVHHFPFLI